VPGCEVVISCELRLKGHRLTFELCDINVLRPNERKFRLVLERIHRRIPAQRDDRNEEFRSANVHLRETVKHVDDPSVVELTVGLQ